MCTAGSLHSVAHVTTGAGGNHHGIPRATPPPSAPPPAQDGTDHGVVPVGRRLVLVALAGLLALALSACGTSGATTTGAASAEAGDPGGSTVTIQDMAYTPATLTVAAGATVTWVWQDGAIAHDVKGDGFKSKVMAKRAYRPGSSRLSGRWSVGAGQMPPRVRCHNAPGSIASRVITAPWEAGATAAPGGHMLDKSISGSGVDGAAQPRLILVMRRREP
jgi:plastocyanin